MALDPNFKVDSALNQVLVLDCDEVLVNISPKWCKLIAENWEKKFSRFLHNPVGLPDSSIFARNIYYLNEWLQYENRIPSQEMMSDFLDLYRSSDFYDDLSITNFGKAVKFLLPTNFIQKVYIITHTIPETYESKRKFLVSNFNSNKVECLFINHNKPKHEVIIEEKIKFNLIADDRIDILFNILKYTKCKNKQFMIPKMGYNDLNNFKFKDEFNELALEKNVILGYYEKIT
jgi:hypothetical protein